MYEKSPPSCKESTLGKILKHYIIIVSGILTLSCKPMNNDLVMLPEKSCSLQSKYITIDLFKFSLISFAQKESNGRISSLYKEWIANASNIRIPGN